VERYIGPDATITLDFALARLTGVVDKLLVYPERMEKNLNKMGGLVHSQRVLLALTQAGVSREDSYVLVQRNAMKVWESDGAALAARTAQGRCRRDQGAFGGRDRGQVRSWLSPQACGHDLHPRVRGLTPPLASR
jgi:adenylosuccinate lyase